MKLSFKCESKKGENRKRGSALMTILIVGTGIIVVIGTSLKSGVTEKVINSRHILRHEAKNGSEAVVEYGFADLVGRFTRKVSFPTDELSPNKNPLYLPASFNSFFSSSNLVLDAGVSEIQGGQVPPGEWKYINPLDPANEFDPLKGKLTFVREINVYGKATAKSIRGNKVSAYTMQSLQVRDSPLFAHAIFYNMDLELHPGPTMNIYGPVHSNVDAWLSGSNKITFHEGVFAAGNVLHGLKKKGNHQQGGNVFIKDAAGVKQNMYIGGDKTTDAAWLDSRNPDWRELASQRWDGNLQDQAHGVPTLNPIGITDYIADDPYTPADELQNHAYSIIEPVLSEAHPDYKGEAVRKEKFAYKAGLILRVSGSRLVVPNNNTPAATQNNNYTISAFKYQRTNPADPKSLPVISPVTGSPIELPVTLPPGMIGGADSTMTNIDATKDGKTDEYFRDPSNDRVKNGMFDHREDKGLDMISIDMDKLREYVDDNHPSNVSSGIDKNGLSAAHWGGSYDPVKDWNGVVYVEVPIVANSGGRIDKIVKGSDPNLAVQTIDAKKLPNPSYALDPGLTLATNSPLYLLGNFNADGVAHTNDAQAIEAGEPPAAVAADTLTVLSKKWIPSVGNNRKYSHHNSTTNRKGAFTEVAAAILTGLKPTIPNDAVPGSSSNAQSGGAHNFPRFLEKWKSTLTIRGSLVALFESEVHSKAMPDAFGKYYSPPTRDWGFNDNFRNGNYPPGSPNARTFRRIAFRDLNKNEYANLVAAIWTGP